MSPETLESILTVFSYDLALKTKPSQRLLTEIQETLIEYHELLVKFQGLKRYLELPKFHGTENDQIKCCHCGKDTAWRARKDWVAVGDIFDRL